MSSVDSSEDSFDDMFSFAEESDATDSSNIFHSTPLKPWKILIADDEPEVHKVTNLVFDEIEFEGKPIEALHAYSGKEALEVLANNPDIAVILLDVVMETDEAGLDVVRALRSESRNSLVRIILRTGQPGKVPEKSVITAYEINDYKDKTELTVAKLYTSIIAALRNYRDLKTIEKSRIGLEKIISSSASLLDSQSLRQFSESILTQLLSILQLDESSLFVHQSAFTATKENDILQILAATGSYEDLHREEIPVEVQAHIDQAVREGRSIEFEDAFVGYFLSRKGDQNILYITGTKHLRDHDLDLIRVFCNNVAIAFDNIYLNMEILETQKEMILKMGDIVENRSKETANHVYRVAEYSYYLALAAGLSEEEATQLRHASPMHDAGKVGIADSILLKPGKLTDEEFDVMRTHTTIGHAIFASSHREIIKAAAIVALQHHEKWDGSGYPNKLSGKDIHIFGRITALADVFDALSHKREYKEAWSFEDTLQFLADQKGKHFDPELVDIFFNIKEQLIEINKNFPDTIG